MARPDVLLSMETTSAIARAVEPLRAAAVERATKMAREIADETLADYAKNPRRYDYPNGSLLNRRDYSVQKQRRARLLRLVKNVGSTLVVKYERDDAAVEKYVVECGIMASEQYNLFIRKLETKVGDHLTATLDGDHVWGYSTLTVGKADGSTEQWRTQQIVNVSVLGKLFNQWPSRKVKQ